MEYAIRNVATEQELDRALDFEKRVFLSSPHIGAGEYSKERWLECMRVSGDLMLYAEAGGDVVGIVFGRIGADGNITVGPVATDARYRQVGIARQMMDLLEKRARARGVRLLSLGAAQSAEGFYIKCGYTPFLFVQAGPPVTLDALRALNTRYREAWSHDDGAGVRLMLATDGIDRELQRAYDAAFPGCSTQTVFMKALDASESVHS